MSKLVVGIVIYEDFTAKYLPYFLLSLQEQTFQDFALVVFDNSEQEFEKNSAEIKKFYPNVSISGMKKNLGFSYAYNFLIREAIDKKAEYFLVINPDIILEKDAIAKMIAALDQDNSLGSVCPKLKRWDFANNKKTNTIDSCGIKLMSGLRFFDIGAGEEDQGQFDNAEILGPSGAAAMLRLSALEKIKQNNQYFDELMFMYKEDCDLAYRLHLAGFKSKCVSEAIAYHDRTASGKRESNIDAVVNRRYKSRQVKEWSFLNQHILFVKYWQRQSFANKLAILWYKSKMFIFALLFEPYLFKQYLVLIKIRKKIKGVY